MTAAVAPTRVVIVAPYVARYRVGLFDRMQAALAVHDLDLVIAHGAPPPSHAGRLDAAISVVGHDVRVRWISVLGREVPVRRLDSLSLGPGDLVIVEQAIKNPDTYSLLMRPRRSRPRIAMWGHGRSFSTPQSRAAAAAKSRLTLRAEWFFAYTPAGAEHVIDHGFPSERVTVLNNTMDTEALSADLDGVTEADVARFRALHGLVPGRTALFVGGVDDAKGIDFLLEAAQALAERLPGFVLLVAGEGRGAARLSRVSAPYLRILGRLDGRPKALALRSADVLAVPEWIGLVAVDSLISGVPLVSTDHASHSPERDYLVDGVTSVFSAHGVAAYADALAACLVDEDLRSRLRRACLEEAPHHSIGAMTDNFVGGILDWSRLDCHVA